MTVNPSSLYPSRIEQSVINYYTNAVSRIYNIGFKALKEMEKPILEIDSMTNAEFETFWEKITKPPTPGRDGTVKDRKFFTRSGRAVSAFSYNKLSTKYKKNVQTGAPLQKVIPSATRRVHDFAETNTGLIKNLKEDSRQKVSSIVNQGFTQGKSTKDIADELTSEFNISKSKGEFWATDQVAKINANIDEIRSRDAGFNRYKWIDADDKRVRTSHGLRDQEVYYYGVGLQPGIDYRCRCIAEPTIEPVDQKKQANTDKKIQAFEAGKKDNSDIKVELEDLGFRKVVGLENFNREKLEKVTDTIGEYSKAWTPINPTNTISIKNLMSKKGEAFAHVDPRGINTQWYQAELAFSNTMFGKNPKKARLELLDRSYDQIDPKFKAAYLYRKKGFDKTKAATWHELGHMFEFDLGLTPGEKIKLGKLYNRYTRQDKFISIYSVTQDKHEFLAEYFTYFNQNKNLGKVLKDPLTNDIRLFILGLQKRAKEKAS